MTVPAIAVSNLRRLFGGRTVLHDLSLSVERGEVFALLGANGSGKTTLVEILATLLFPTSGRASIHGFDVVAEAADVRRLIGYCPSSLHSFYPRLSGRRNLEFFAALYGLDRRAGARRIDQLLERVDLVKSARDRVERYSDGMKARLSIARALLANPPVLLLDEPTKSLDAEGRQAVRALVRGAAADGGARTALWVTHDVDEARAVANRVGALDGGRLQETV